MQNLQNVEEYSGISRMENESVYSVEGVGLLCTRHRTAFESLIQAKHVGVAVLLGQRKALLWSSKVRNSCRNGLVLKGSCEHRRKWLQ